MAPISTVQERDLVTHRWFDVVEEISLLGSFVQGLIYTFVLLNYLVKRYCDYFHNLG